MKQTNHELLLDLFHKNGNVLTLGQLLQYPFGYKCTSRFSELRDRGYKIECEKATRASDNIYRLLAEPDINGQINFA